MVPISPTSFKCIFPEQHPPASTPFRGKRNDKSLPLKRKTYLFPVVTSGLYIPRFETHWAVANFRLRSTWFDRAQEAQRRAGDRPSETTSESMVQRHEIREVSFNSSSTPPEKIAGWCFFLSLYPIDPGCALAEYKRFIRAHHGRLGTLTHSIRARALYDPREQRSVPVAFSNITHSLLFFILIVPPGSGQYPDAFHRLDGVQYGAHPRYLDTSSMGTSKA